MFGIREETGRRPLSQSDKNPLALLVHSLTIVWKRPKVGLGGIVATITTTSEFGFLVFLPIFFTKVVGFSLEQWLQILSIMFATNVAFNLLWGYVGDRIGWRRTITFVGSCGCAVTTLGLYYVPHIFGPNYFLVTLASMAYGAALAGFVPIGAIMATLAPESRGRGDVDHESGIGDEHVDWAGDRGDFLPLLGVGGVIWIFAGMYLVAAVISFNLRLPGEKEQTGRERGDSMTTELTAEVTAERRASRRAQQCKRQRIRRLCFC